MNLDLKELVNVLHNKNDVLKSLYPGKVVYYIDHGKVRTRTIIDVKYIGHVSYRGQRPTVLNTYYGSSQRTGLLVNIKFNRGDYTDILVENNGNMMYSYSMKYWINRNILIKKLQRRFDEYMKANEKYQSLADHFKEMGIIVVGYLNQLGEEIN